MNLHKDVSNRISMIRTIMILGVVFLHTPGYLSDRMSDIGPGLFLHFAAFFKNGVFRGTVPTLSLISGYLLFAANADLAVTKLFKKKFYALVIPFVCFNLLSLFASTLLRAMFSNGNPADLLHKDAAFWINGVFGVMTMPFDPPLHFVRDMIVMIALTPLISPFVRKAPWLGLVAVVVVLGLNLEGRLIVRGTSAILFYVGGMAAVHQWNVRALDKHAKACALLFFALCAAMMAFKIDDNTFLVMVSPFLVWPAMSLLQGTQVERKAISWSKYTFFIFAAHWAPLMFLGWLVYHPLKFIPYPVYWFAAPTLVIALLIWFYNVAIDVVPATFNLLIGSRAIKKPAFVERRKAPRSINAPVYSEVFRRNLLGQDNHALSLT